MIGSSKPSLGRLERVELRDAWVGEATDFTPWLAQPENIALLGEAIGIELEVESQEKSVGQFRADILCRDTVDRHYVLIENQLERTDHTHLGQLLTYAAGLDAVMIIWVAARFTDEHRAALDWLNRATASGFNFFGLEIELWRIGESALAPKFNVVSKPNDWSRAIREQAGQSGELTATEQLHLEFWTQFRQYLESIGSSVRISRPWKQYWANVPVGRTNFTINAWNNARDGRSGVFLLLSGPDAKAHFSLIEERYRAEVEDRLAGFGQVSWDRFPNYQMSQIGVRRPSTLTNRSEWPALNEWMAKALEATHSLFTPIVRTQDASEWLPPQDQTSPDDEPEPTPDGPPPIG